MSIHVSKRAIKHNWPLIVLSVFILLVIGLTVFQGTAFAEKSSSDPLRPFSRFAFGECYYGDCYYVPPVVEELPPPVGPDRDEAKCKMLVYPRTITLGEPFEVCWVGHKFSDVALGPDRSLTPSESNAYLTTLENGKTLWCHSYLVPSSSNTSVNPGVYDFRCSGPGGTILATTVNVIP